MAGLAVRTGRVAVLLSVWCLFLARPEIARAQTDFEICYNYSCAETGKVHVKAAQLQEMHRFFEEVSGAVEEREAVREALAALYRIAGEQTPIAADRAGNFNDDPDTNGRMDCIDHSTTATTMLKMMEAQGWLRFHRMLEPARRSRFIFQHFSAVLEELGEERVLLITADCEAERRFCKTLNMSDSGEEMDNKRRFVVDPWYVEPGELAIVMTLEEWLRGGGPSDVW